MVLLQDDVIINRYCSLLFQKSVCKTKERGCCGITLASPQGGLSAFVPSKSIAKATLKIITKWWHFITIHENLSPRKFPCIG